MDNEDIKQIKHNVISDWFKKGSSIQEIAEETGYSKAYVYKILKQKGLIEGKRGRPLLKKESISPLYEKIGELLHFQRYYTLKRSEGVVAKKCHSTSTRIRNIEKGFYRLTLEEFNKICVGYDIRPDEVLRIALNGK